MMWMITGLPRCARNDKGGAGLPRCTRNDKGGGRGGGCEFIPKDFSVLIWHNFYVMQDKYKKILFACVFLLVLGLVVGVLMKNLMNKTDFYYAGTLETAKVIVSSRVASDVADVFVVEGDNVYKGQPLLELSCDVYKIFAQQINSDFDRATMLLGKGHLSQAEYDIVARTKQDNDLKLNWCVVQSPIDGMLVTKFREIGEVVAPGAPLISVANPYDIWAYFYVPYDMLYQLKVGQNVIGILPEANGMKFNGRIVKINEYAEFTPKNVQTREERTRLVYGIKVQFENPELILKSGMTIESSLMPNEKY